MNSNYMLVPYSLFIFSALTLAIFSLGDALLAAIGRLSDVGFLTSKRWLGSCARFLFGLRAASIMAVVLGYLNLSFSASGICILLLAAAWALKRLAQRQSVFWGGAETNSQQPCQPLVPNAALILTVILLLCVGTLGTMESAWDHFTYWLLVPREILTNNAMAGFYPMSRSCCINYPPQQIVFGALFLSLWSPVSLSASPLFLFTPFVLLLMLMMIDEYAIELKLNHWYRASIVIAVLTALGVMGVYFNHFHGDALVALTLLFSVLALGKLIHPISSRNLLTAVLIATTAIIAKPYTLPLVILFLIFCAYRSGSVRVSLAIFVLAALLYAIEIGLYLQAVKMYVTPLDYVNFKNIKVPSLYYLRTVPLDSSLILCTGVSLLSLLFIPTFKQNAQIRSTYILASLSSSTFVLMIILLSATWAGLGDSAPRYILNATGVLAVVLVSLIAYLQMTTQFAKNRCCAIAVFICAFSGFLISSSAGQIKKGVDKCITTGPFPELIEHSRFRKELARLQELEDGSPQQVLLLYQEPSTYAAYRWSYLLSFQSKSQSIFSNFFHPDDSRSKEYRQIHSAIKSGSYPRELIEKLGIDLIFFPSVWNQFDPPIYGVYTATEIEERLRHQS